MVCIGFGVISALVLVWATFSMNTKYGEWGLMKLHALRSHPRYIISGESSSGCFLQLLKTERHEKRNENSHAGKQVPLLAVENGCIISKDADITVAYRWNCRNSSR